MQIYVQLADETHIYDASILPPIPIFELENAKQTVVDNEKWTTIKSSTEKGQ
jgi:hypothetical protein